MELIEGSNGVLAFRENSLEDVDQRYNLIISRGYLGKRHLGTLFWDKGMLR